MHRYQNDMYVLDVQIVVKVHLSSSGLVATFVPTTSETAGASTT